MSSYRPVDETKTLAKMTSLAREEIIALEYEMRDLCAIIANKFPNKFQEIAKYKQSETAWMVLVLASAVLEIEDGWLTAHTMESPITVKVGRQTRHNRSSSQRVRLGNVVVRLRGVAKELQKKEHPTLLGLEETIERLGAVVFPVRYG